jgi:hypothetical protein
MPKALTYDDAVRLLTGASPFATALGTAASGAAGAAGVPSVLDVQALTTTVATKVSSVIRARETGVSCLDRGRRLQAAHAILVVAAFFEAFDALDLPIRLQDAKLSRADQAMLAGGPPEQGWLASLLRAAIPAPDPATPFAALREELRKWYAGQAPRLHDHLAGLAVVDALDETRRARLRRAMEHDLADRAVERFMAAYLRLCVDVPEFGLWAWRADADAKDAALAAVLAALDPARERAELRRLLAVRYQADLLRALGGVEQDSTGCAVPSLGESYVSPAFRVRPGGRADTPGDEFWWTATERRADLPRFVAAFLTRPEAAAAPLVVLGQPGSGKSALTRVLAARLGDGDFLPVRVPLREVSADAEPLEQIEEAVRHDTGERVTWPDLCRAAAGALPVVLLDGFDELLQATGVGRSDYLVRIARLQQAQADLGRPFAIVVTTRTAVAGRAPLPDGAMVARLEPFSDEQVAAWLAGWNQANADHPPLAPATALLWPELARQPLLLLMLALYEAQGGDLTTMRPGGLTRAALYERLLYGFADREIHKDLLTALEPSHRQIAVEDELLRLSVVAFAMLNRDRQWVTAEELEADLRSLELAGPARAPAAEFAAPETAAERALARFFFIHRAQALQDGRARHTYEFLHATFGEFLAARLVARILADVVAREASPSVRPAPAHDELLYSLLSHAPLHGQGAATLEFVAALTRPEVSRRAHDWLCRAFRLGMTRLDVPTDAYLPVPLPARDRLTRYGLNLTLIAMAVGGAAASVDLFPDESDPAECLGRVAHGWQSTLRREQWTALVGNLSILRERCADGRRDMVLSLGTCTVAPEHDLAWVLEDPVGADVLAAMALRMDVREELCTYPLRRLGPDLDVLVTRHVEHRPGDLESLAESLVGAWMAVTDAREDEQLVEAVDRLVTAVTSTGFVTRAPQMIPVALRMVILCADRLRDHRQAVGRWLLRFIEVGTLGQEDTDAVHELSTRFGWNGTSGLRNEVKPDR